MFFVNRLFVLLAMFTLLSGCQAPPSPTPETGPLEGAWQVELDPTETSGVRTRFSEQLSIETSEPGPVQRIDHIGIGGDYDGMPTGPIGMEDVTGYPALFVELAKRGYSQEDLEKIASRNMLRVMRDAEAYAASVTDMAPIEYPAGEPRDAGD